MGKTPTRGSSKALKQTWKDSGTVLVLMADESLSKRVVRMLREAGIRIRIYLSRSQLTTTVLPEGPVCLVMCATGGRNCGLKVYETLKADGLHLPVVFLAATDDFRLAVMAMRAGAEDCVPVPFDEIELLAGITGALNRSRQFLLKCSQNLALRRRAAALTEREREIVRLVLAGMLNKQIAAELNLALVTVKVHRGRAMRKLGARTSAELARIARHAGIGPVGSPPITGPSEE